MKTLVAGRIIAPLKARFQILRSQRFFSDKLSLALIVPALALNILTFIILVFRLRPTDFAVPSHYSNLTGFDGLGPWYQAYSIPIFALSVTILNAGLAVRSFTYSRITSFYLLIGSFVVALFSIIIATAFAVIV